jgi:hypothetical protein
MTEKPRILPVDPMEVSRTPVEGVDIPEELSEEQLRKGSDPLATREGDKLEEAAEAAQRGRTA